ncbi:hypothetical protein Ahy_B10g104688 [Arachis hypogaea]|uniref:SWIM-type domain-containing protein n=1 Tax=Arachis hypogaea TaxID=3818 RepID=A0A444X688_ARAHY|nr:hypothetical protein Ahy_B10g104688 [Arachis hypogaea]
MAWALFLIAITPSNVVTIDGVGIISDRHNSIDAVIACSNGAWSPPRAWHMFCIRHIGSNFLRRLFKALYLHKLVVNTGNIVVNRFDRRNEMFEVREMQNGSIYTVNFMQRHCDCGHFKVERLPYRHVLEYCAN